MKLNVAQVLGLNTDQKAALLISQPADFENAFFAVLQLTSDDAFTKGRLTLSALSDFYFETEGSPAEKIKTTYEEAEKQLKGGEFDIIVAAISGKVLYFIGKGDLQVILKRDSKISSLMSLGAPQNLVSGFLQEGDRIFFATKNLTSFLADDIDKSLNLPMEVFEQDLTERIAVANLEGDGLAGLLVEIEKEEQVIEGLNRQTDREMSKDIPLKTPIVARYLEKILFILNRVNFYIPKSGRGKLLLAAVLLILVAAGAGLRFKSVSDAQKQTQFMQALQRTRDDFSSAKGLVSLNPVEAKNKLNAAKENIDKALSLKPNDEEAKNLKIQIEEESSSILQQSIISQFPLFLDLNLVKEKFNAKSLSLSAGKILLLDPTLKTLILVDIAKKTNEILAGSENLGDATFASLNGALAFVFSKDKGILRIDTGSKKITEVSKTDEEWGAVSDIYGFASNIYLLDTTSQKIWKYLPTADGYSSKREYLTAATKAALATPFADSLRMQIESSIYVLKLNGEMLRFTRGEKDFFGYEGLDKGIKDPKSFFVSSETDNLYLLDSGNSRLLILTKTGSYKGQMEGEKFATATDLVVDEEGKKIYLLEGSKIYTVDLK